MKTIQFNEIKEKITEMCGEANTILNDDVKKVFDEYSKSDESETGREVLNSLIKNYEVSEETKLPLCQDTGVSVFFIELGNEVNIEGGLLTDAITEGVRTGYEKHYLRKSMCHPLKRKNTTDNTPPIIHLTLVKGDNLKITLAPKGGGAENMSALSMMTPGDGIEGIKKFVIDTVSNAGANPCPPIVVGVGIGGNFEASALLAKKSLIRTLNEPNKDPELAAIEKELLEKINKLGIGPLGFGGTLTAMAVHIEMMPCHIASLPVAININCHSHRHKEVVL